jgi:hypothetical protein
LLPERDHAAAEFLNAEFAAANSVKRNFRAGTLTLVDATLIGAMPRNVSASVMKQRREK